MSDQLMSESEITGALTPVDRSLFMPAMSIELAVERYNTLVEFVSRVLRREVDYGVIPGTDKLTLLKPGAEKLTTFFGLSTKFQLIERIEDWMGENYGGEPFFYYMYRCQLFRGDVLIAESDGSCNSREQKYRYREAQRMCPECKQAAIIKGREEFGGGWLCWSKKGGCGAKFLVGDPAIESQQVGRVPNAEIADQVNTMQKISQKRALIAATLLAVNASEFFTQDVEDMVISTGAGETQQVETPSEPRPTKASTTAGSKGPTAAASAAVRAGEERARLDREILDACHALGKTEEQLVDWLRKKYQVEDVGALTPLHKREVLLFLQSKIAKQATT